MNTWLISLLSLVALATLLTAFYIWNRRPATPYTAEQVRAGIHHKTIHHVIDVRDSEAWSDGHYSRAYHIPLKQLPSMLPATLHDRSRMVLFYGGAEKAFKAAQVAQELGYSSVGYLVEGSYREFEHRDPPIKSETVY